MEQLKVFKMKKAIKVIENRIHALNTELKAVEKRIEEPELLSDYEFARNDAGNIEMEIIELNQAIEILNKHVK